MKKFCLRIQLLSLLALMTALWAQPVAAANYTELPVPQWTVKIPKNTSTDYFYKNYYTLGKKFLPILSEDNGSYTAYTLLHHTPGGKSKPSYQVMALDDKTGSRKWIRSLPYSYNAFDMDLNGNLYYVDKVKSGKKTVYNLVALDSNNKQRWVKTFTTSNNYSVLDDGRIAVIGFAEGKDTLELYSSEGKLLHSRSYAGIIRHIQGNYVGLVNYTGDVTALEIYSVSTNKKIAAASLPKEFFNRVHADFDVLSGGTVLVPVFDAKTGIETLHGYSPDGKRKWSRVLPTPEPNYEDKLFMSIGNNYLVQDKNSLNVYDTNNRLVAARTFDDLPGQGSLQRLGNQSISFGAAESKGYWYDYEKPTKAVFHVLDARTLQTLSSLTLEQAPFSERNIRFLNASTFYIDLYDRLSKYELK
ncbi:hypothetical protein [Cohnella boryungensis]|uniref:Uncharacterized protein n=1 Tax=Cohnella boryungensis TaxID=768479 RepID=A0ABV8SDX5_9BACL